MEEDVHSTPTVTRVYNIYIACGSATLYINTTNQMLHSLRWILPSEAHEGTLCVWLPDWLELAVELVRFLGLGTCTSILTRLFPVGTNWNTHRPVICRHGRGSAVDFSSALCGASGTARVVGGAGTRETLAREGAKTSLRSGRTVQDSAVCRPLVHIILCIHRAVTI